MTDYRRYLVSRAWYARKRAVRAMRKVCQGCGAANHLDVHHKHYDTLGHESIDDLELLCRDCHCRRHGRRNRDPQRSNPRLIAHIFRDMIAQGEGPK